MHQRASRVGIIEQRREDVAVTEMLDTTKIDEIRAIIDRGLGTTQSRELIAASEVADLLLDLRLLLATSDAELEAAPTN
ncbi:MAG: hypothetical protein Ct9H300mP12_02020 [Acidimicrobiales bacterium]|jgi:hypothetical protein|nr:MAG: hypothetical protein CM1200mP26_08650 [Acidimicrobiales bacterium]GIT45617.1 MAG: hypothetical protein Ct9H300mP12_02020 [Acidimicrobiales bacterium]